MSQNIDTQVISSSAEGKWVGYWESATAGESELKLPEQYAVLLVLEGEIVFTFEGYANQTVAKNSLVVIDRRQLTSYIWVAGTAMLEFTPPEKMFPFFACCSNAFRIPCSGIVPVLPDLQKWIDDLMIERLRPQEVLTADLRRDYCARLGNILRNYPPVLVGELLVAFHACSISGEKKCNAEVCM